MWRWCVCIDGKEISYHESYNIAFIQAYDNVLPIKDKESVVGVYFNSSISLVMTYTFRTYVLERKFIPGFDNAENNGSRIFYTEKYPDGTEYRASYGYKPITKDADDNIRDLYLYYYMKNMKEFIAWDAK